MAIIIITGTFFGDYLDNSNNSEIPFYTIIFSIFSIILSLYYVLRKIVKDNDKK
jgi:F0F1-type ATP synthase assembly protein I|tara:strand:- start:916 stop:1077 length:162 start_codon:yes stop_codon:yes gene_type:complete